MREIQRTIVSALVFSKDGKMLMGRKDPSKGGVYPNAWHIPGGGVDDGETFEQTLARELQEEVGIDIAECRVVPLTVTGAGTSEKTLPSGETVISHMEFNYFEVYFDNKNADEITLALTDDLIEAKWFSPEELVSAEQIPGGKEFFKEMGYIK